MRNRHAWLFGLCALLISHSALVRSADVSSAEDQARQFLALLHVPMKNPVPTYEPRLRAEPTDVMKFIDPDGVVVWNAMELPNPEKKYRAKTIASQLAKHRGAFYLRLSHLGQTASIPYPGYSELTFKQVGSEKMLVALSFGYTLTFIKRGERFMLSRIKYDVEERE